MIYRIVFEMIIISLTILREGAKLKFKNDIRITEFLMNFINIGSFEMSLLLKLFTHSYIDLNGFVIYNAYNNE